MNQIAMNYLIGTEFMPSIIIYVISLGALLIGSLSDLKTREVPDWLNYGLIISGVGLNLLFSVIYSNSTFIINSIAGLAILFVIAYIMFYAGQWGGGDSKMLMALGSMIGIDLSFKTPQFLFGFFINALIVGAIYGILWGIFLAYRNKKKFMREFARQLSKKKVIMIKKIIVVLFVLSFIILFSISFYHLKMLILILLLMTLMTFYLWVFGKAVEKSCMYHSSEPHELTEGDWIVKDVFVNGKYICGPKDLGIQKEQIKKLIGFYKQGKIKKILIKTGIPFVPSFLIAFIITLIFGQWVV